MKNHDRLKTLLDLQFRSKTSKFEEFFCFMNNSKDVVKMFLKRVKVFQRTVDFGRKAETVPL